MITMRMFIRLVDAFIKREQDLKSIVKILYFLLSKNQAFINWNGTSFKFHVMSDLEFFRAMSVKAEPMTDKWIDTIVSRNDVFYDIGANVGIYSLYASKTKNCKVFAFEPLFHNFFSLNCNVLLNGLNNNITTYNVSVHSHFDVDRIFLGGLDVGSAMATFKHPDQYIQKGDAKYIQGSIGLSVDELVKFLPFPNHIKIDVDGNEPYIVEGMQNTLKNNCLKSVLVEILDSNDHAKIIDVFKKSGFKLWSMGRPGIDCCNYIFVKNSLQNHKFKSSDNHVGMD